jgi:predicted GNAT superfamily acetyltransferase
VAVLRKPGSLSWAFDVFGVVKAKGTTKAKVTCAVKLVSAAKAALRWHGVVFARKGQATLRSLGRQGVAFLVRQGKCQRASIVMGQGSGVL